MFKAAGSKWNFHNYQPGLVGGHCIGVDPYYMTFLCDQIKFQSKIITAGREINDGMAYYVSSKILELSKEKIVKKTYRVLIIGASFKENCRDIRNSKIFDIYKFLRSFGCLVDIKDDLIDPREVHENYGINLRNNPQENYYDGLVLAVPHKIYQEKGVSFVKNFGNKNSLLFDIKSIYKKEESDWRL